MKKILFIVRNFSKGGPQPIRFQNIVKCLQSEFEIHIIEFTHSNDNLKSEDGLSIHQLQYSKIGRLLNPHKTATRAGAEGLHKKKLIGIIVSNIKAFIRSVFFPDTLLFETINLKKKIFTLNKQFGFEIVVASAFPFSTLAVSKKVKRINPSIKFVYDIGDPFYGNAKNGFLRNFFAKKFEKYYLRFIDKLIVTNELTKKHYLKTYNNCLSESKIAIIEQGVKSDFIQNVETIPSLKEKKEVTLTYAGQLYLKLREPFALYEAIAKANILNKSYRLHLQMLGSYSKVFINNQIAPNNIHFLGSFDQNEVFSLYKKSDIVVFFDNAFGMQTPGKIFEIIAIGKPILYISNNIGSPAYHIAKQFNHIFYTENNPNSIINSIEEVLQQDSFNIDITQLRSFVWENRAMQYKEVLESL